MRLSMWMLADWLAKYHPVVKIGSGNMVLRGARILSESTKIEPQNVYLASANEFFGDERNKVICVQNHDILLLDATDKEAVLNDIFDAFDYYNGWYDGLENAILEGCSLQRLVDASDDIFGNPIIIFNASHIVTAYSQNQQPDIDKEWSSIITTHSHSLEIMELLSEHIKKSRFHSQIQHLNFPFVGVTALERMLFQGPTPMGRIIILERNKKLSEGKVQLMDILGHLTERWIEKNQKSDLMQEESQIFRELLSQKNVSPETLSFKLTLNGWRETDEKLLLKLEIPSASSDITGPLQNQLIHLFPENYVFAKNQTVFILANLSRTSEQTLCREIIRLQKQSSFFCGISYPFTDVMKLHEADEQCSIALTFSLGQQRGIYRCRDYALNYIKNILHTHLDAAVIHPALKLLRRNDRQNHDELYRTLFEYLTNNCNIAQTARILNLHRNSLLYRLNKIRELTAIDLADCECRQYLYLSFLQENKL